MTWQRFALSRQLLTEERVGTAMREAQAEEDDKFSSAVEALKRRL